MTTYEDIEPYLTDFLKGEVEEAMEYRILAYLQQNPSFQKELDELEETLAILEKNTFEEPDPSMKMAFYAMLSEEKKKQEVKFTWSVNLEKLFTFFQNKMVLGSALAVGLVLIIFFAGYWTSSIVENNPQNALSFEQKKKNSEEKIFSENENIEEEELEEDREITEDTFSENKEVYAEDGFEMEDSESIALLEDDIDVPDDMGDLETSSVTTTNRSRKPSFAKEVSKIEVETSDRIQSVYASLNQPNNDTRIVNALIKTLNTDPNPNVRIAAIDALERFMRQPKVRLRIAQSLNSQQSPTTQLATLDLLVKYEIREGKKYIKQFLKQSALNTTVREQAEIALEVLS